jgi:hypothetical protein
MGLIQIDDWRQYVNPKILAIGQLVREFVTERVPA